MKSMVYKCSGSNEMALRELCGKEFTNLDRLDNRTSVLYVQPYVAYIKGVDVVLLSLIKGLDQRKFRVEA